MALNKTIITETGFDAVYWNVTKFTLLKSAKVVSFTMAGYKDKETYEGGGMPLVQENSYRYDLDLSDPSIAYFDSLQIHYTNLSGNKNIDIMFNKSIDLSNSFTTDIPALINQILLGCYLTIKQEDKFVDAIDIKETID